jgi:SAGA-associated factor 29
VLIFLEPSIEGIESLSTLYREQIRIADDQKARAQDEDLLSKISVLIGMIKHNEETMDAQPPARVGSSRNSAMDFDGPSDSPIPSPAENKQVRKIGPSRTSSQPPRNSSDIPDIAVSEANERVSKPKIVYAKDEEVAFKRKVAGGKPDEQDWILGRVMRVIGEGKSRRYEVQDPFPDEGSVNPLFKSSASQMVPIPPEGTALEDYEVGKRVLALYPDTTTFYRAEVKAMLDGGARVQLLFEDEAAGALKIVERRFVLDHKG